MVESYLDTEKVKVTEHNFIQEDIKGQIFRGPLILRKVGYKGAVDRERNQYMKFQQKIMQMNGGNNKDGVCAHDVRNGNGNRKYVPFDIENALGREQSFSNLGDNGSNSMGNHKASQSNSKSSVSSVNVLKTLFFILVWYAFSTFLTLYNKTLLGDDLGKFPAPLLMNTVHFAMQAVLSKGITWLWAQRFQPSVSMSWRDYFLRVVPTALGTAMDINLSNASLVFISVTFATMVGVSKLSTFGNHLCYIHWSTVNSAVTVTIAGVVKEAVTTLVAVYYFHDQFTWLKGVGLITVMVGVSFFNWYKYRKLQKGELGEQNLASSSTTNATAKYVILE